jgi:NADH dehydrogenase FAD-containing subunit
MRGRMAAGRSAVKTIAIVGGGFAGTTLLRELDGRLPPGYELLLISDESYTTFNPLLPEALGASVFPEQVVAPIRQMIRTARFVMGRVTAVDHARRTLRCETLAGPREERYEHLLLAFGNRARLDLLPGLAEHGLALKTVGDALHVRNMVLRRVARIELETDPALRARLGHFVVIGGGFSGVETAGALVDCLAGIRRYYPRVDPAELRVTLLHDHQRLLPELSERLGNAAHASLAARGVQVRVATRARLVGERGVMLATGEFVPAATVICTIGTQPNALVERMLLPIERGRIVVNADLSVQGRRRPVGAGRLRAGPERARRPTGPADGAVCRARGEARGGQPAGVPRRRSDAGIPLPGTRRDGGDRAPARRRRRARRPAVGPAGVAALARLLPCADADVRTEAADLRRVDMGHVLRQRRHPPAVHAQPGPRRAGGGARRGTACARRERLGRQSTLHRRCEPAAHLPAGALRYEIPFLGGRGRPWRVSRRHAARWRSRSGRPSGPWPTHRRHA